VILSVNAFVLPEYVDLFRAVIRFKATLWILTSYSKLPWIRKLSFTPRGIVKEGYEGFAFVASNTQIPFATFYFFCHFINFPFYDALIGFIA
jgi:hypothetical protein